MKCTTPRDEIQRIVDTQHPDPFQVLGQHAAEIEGLPGWVVRAFQPESRSVELVLVESGEIIPLLRFHDLGFFEAQFRGRQDPLPLYRLRVTNYEGMVREFTDSYFFLPTLSETDLGLFVAGKNYHISDVLGAHTIEAQGVRGVRFAVWAPAARAVSVIGTFNTWDRRKHPMRKLGRSGVWEIFVPGLAAGELYKYQIITWQGALVDKTDPYAFRCEIAPDTGSVVYDLGRFSWRDQEWMERRATLDIRHQPLNIYEVHVGSWLRSPRTSVDPPNFRDIAPRLIAYVLEMGYTHIELLPVTEHPFGGSWGYQTTGYYAPSSRWGTPEDLMFLIDLAHRQGIGVILDWVPAHFPKDISALGRFDGTALYEHLDPRKGEHPDWGTFIFNYGRSEVRNFLLGSALFWMEKYHVDGLRIDAVSSMLYLDYNRAPGEWVPNIRGGRENLEAISFLRELNELVQQQFPGVFTCAEESTAFPGVTKSVKEGGLGFTFKWNLGWMHDILEFLAVDPLYRKAHQNKLTFSIWYAFHEAFILPLSHDEVVHLKNSLLMKMPGDAWKKYANFRLLMMFQLAHPGKKLLFMGGDLAQPTEWNHDMGLDWSLLADTYHHGANTFLRDLNLLYRREPALWEVDYVHTTFEWLDFSDSARSIITFIRRGRDTDDELIFVFNFTPVVRYRYRIGIDKAGTWVEVFNSDARIYGGSDVGNGGKVESRPGLWSNRPHSLSLTLPPLGVLVLKRELTEAEKLAQNERRLQAMNPAENPPDEDSSEEGTQAEQEIPPPEPVLAIAEVPAGKG